MPVICFAPQYVCEALLRAEGFTDIGYVDSTVPAIPEDSGGASSISLRTCRSSYIGASIKGVRSPLLTGLHVGCYELFAHGEIRSIADLKGKKSAGSARPG